jgi:hypothetical protein
MGQRSNLNLIDWAMVEVKEMERRDSAVVVDCIIPLIRGTARLGGRELSLMSLLQSTYLRLDPYRPLC